MICAPRKGSPSSVTWPATGANSRPVPFPQPLIATSSAEAPTSAPPLHNVAGKKQEIELA
jgi:hypothetical protein